MNMDRTFTPEEAETYLAFILRYNRENPDTGKYLMFANDAFIGVGALYCRPEGAEIECMLLPEFWNRGHATEIVSELLKVAHGKPEIQQIRAMMDPKNAASRRVLIKNSFVYETTEHIAEDNTDAETCSIQL
ncbi:MAG: GNAT family N-acetyltransferase [Clostridia bacterium]|nr:GNAT family N-acetyltransferase [Clostridia bacterium]